MGSHHTTTILEKEIDDYETDKDEYESKGKGYHKEGNHSFFGRSCHGSKQHDMLMWYKKS